MCLAQLFERVRAISLCITLMSIKLPIGRNEFIATSYIVSGQSGSRKQLIQETQPELDASFFSSTPYEATIVPGIISSSLEEPETSD